MDITSANAIYTLQVANLFTTPIQLQQFSADNVFGTEPLASAETSMGIDGNLSAGFVYVPVVQSVELQADSASNDLFDQWWQAMQIAQAIFPAQGLVTLLSIGKKWTLRNGVLTTFPPIPDAQKILRPRRFGITWERVSPSPIS
jgi:hypothetical protein